MRGAIVYYKSSRHGARVGAAPRTLWTLAASAAAANDSHLYGIPRRITLAAGGALAKLYGLLLNDTKVHNRDTLMSLVMSRPPGTPLVTVCNHVSTLDDPLMWGIRGLPLTNSKLCRWTLAAEDICFSNVLFSYFFRVGKCIPVTRGAGIYQPHMAEALERLNDGDWLNTFPEGKISQEGGPLRRLKWGTASLIARANVSPIVLPIGHSGFEKAVSDLRIHIKHVCLSAIDILIVSEFPSPLKVLPEDWWRGKRPPIPLWNKKVDIVIGEPIQFDIPTLTQVALKWSQAATASGDDRTHRSSFGTSGYNPHPLPCGVRRCSSLLQVAEVLSTVRTTGVDVSKPLLDEAAWRWMYTHITEHIWVALSDVAEKAKTLNQSREGGS